MSHYLSIAFVPLSFAAPPTPCAAAPHAVPASDGKRTWANEDLARRNGIAPGVFRGPRTGQAAENAVTSAERSPYDASAHGDDL